MGELNRATRPGSQCRAHVPVYVATTAAPQNASYHYSAMSDHAGALASVEEQVAAVRDDPAARLALMARVFHGPTGRAPRHLPFRRAALSFMRWQARRGVLIPLDASPPGSA